MLKNLYRLGVAAGVALSACHGSAEAEANVAAATAAAQAWLPLVDAGKYDESWTASAKAFQNGVSQQSWAASAKAVRGPLGALVSRQVQSAQYTTSVPGAPDGKYVIIQFNAVFANKAQAVETVTPMQEADGSWRVSGYYVR